MLNSIELVLSVAINGSTNYMPFVSILFVSLVVFAIVYFIRFLRKRKTHAKPKRQSDVSDENIAENPEIPQRERLYKGMPGYYRWGGCADRYDVLYEAAIADGVKRIDNSAFENETYLTEVIIPESVTSIGHSVFSRCKSLKSIIIPNSVTYINMHTFAECSSLVDVIIPDNVAEIGNYSFSKCKSLIDVKIPNGVTYIGTEAFGGCDKLRRFIMPDKLKQIGERAFYGCESLTEVILPDGVTHIGGHAFSGCKNLKKIVIPDSVVSIGEFALSGCDKLTYIRIPYRFMNIDDIIRIFRLYNYKNIHITDGEHIMNTSGYNRGTLLEELLINDRICGKTYYAFCDHTTESFQTSHEYYLNEAYGICVHKAIKHDGWNSHGTTDYYTITNTRQNMKDLIEEYVSMLKASIGWTPLLERVTNIDAARQLILKTAKERVVLHSDCAVKDLIYSSDKTSVFLLSDKENVLTVMKVSLISKARTAEQQRLLEFLRNQRGDTNILPVLSYKFSDTNNADNAILLVQSPYCSRGLFNYVDTDKLCYSDKIKEYSFPKEDIAAIALQTARALEFLHSNGYVHHDIKPEHFMYYNDSYKTKTEVSEKSGVWCICDFDSVRTLDFQYSGTLSCTHEYAAPEIKNLEPYGYSADIYSWGLCIKKLLEQSHNNRELNSVIERCINPDPALRIQDGAELVKALSSALQ